MKLFDISFQNGGKWAKICRHYYHPRNPKATVIEVFYVKYVTKNPARGGYPPFVSPIYQARFPEIHYSPLQDETFRYEFPKWVENGPKFVGTIIILETQNPPPCQKP